MLNTIPKKIIFLVVSFIVMMILYYPSLNGGPLFDDIHFIFKSVHISDEFSYWTIWRDFSWPVSVSAEKILFQIWQYEFIYYHALNLILHFLNSYLLLRLMGKFDVPYPHFFFLLFLLHPANVISVSWMVQLKTVLCFTFCITAFFFLLKALEDKRYYPLSWLCFLLSVLSKSASLPIVLLFVIYVCRRKGKAQLMWMLPFLLISSYSTYKILNSEITTEASIQIESKSFVAVDNGKSSDHKVLPPEDTYQKDLMESFKSRSISFLKTNHYYFWQSLIPVDSYPIKGQGINKLNLTVIFHLFFILILIYLNWGNFACMSLLLGFIMLSPFLGFFTAPYMTLTWVSEQHLYLALPFFLFFWLSILEKWKFKYASVIPAVVLIFFSVQTYRAAAYYDNEEIFYTKSLEADPHNLPIAY
nr:hypothetical protein [Bdellovibrionales bacterium]